MTVGLGVDIVEIERMAKILEKTPSFETKVFTQDEQAYCRSKSNPATHFAARFAAKEAVCKALGTGIMVHGMHPRLVEVVRDSKGKPSVVLHGKACKVAQEQGVLDIPLSLTYTHSVAVANAVVITKASRLEREQRRDVKAELAEQFKEVRGLLDDLGSIATADIDSTQSSLQYNDTAHNLSKSLNADERNVSEQEFSIEANC